MKDEALKLAKSWFEANTYGDEAVEVYEAIEQALASQPAPVQDLPFGVGGGLVAIKTLLSRDPCVHANTAIEMIDAILKEHTAAQPPVQEPDELRHIGEQDALLDVDEKAWRLLVENRGGCRCHIAPPCGACSNPISEEEMNEVGYTYTTPPAAQPAVQEPVGEVTRYGLDSHGRKWHGIHWYDPNVDVPHGTKLYTTPPAQRQWVGLTDEERNECTQSPFTADQHRAIEAKLKEKNT